MASARGSNRPGHPDPRWADTLYTVGSLDGDEPCGPSATVRLNADLERMEAALERARQAKNSKEGVQQSVNNDFILNMADLHGQLEWDDQELFPERTEREEFVSSAGAREAAQEGVLFTSRLCHGVPRPFLACPQLSRPLGLVEAFPPVHSPQSFQSNTKRLGCSLLSSSPIAGVVG